MAVFRGEQPADFEEDQTKPVTGHANARMKAKLQAGDGSVVDVDVKGAVGTDWRDEAVAIDAEHDGLPTDDLSELPFGYKQRAREVLSTKAQRLARGKKSVKKGARG